MTFRTHSWCNREVEKKILEWRHNGHDGVSKHQPHNCSLNRLFRRRSKKTLKLRVPGLCAGNSPVIGEFPSQKASNAENVSIWWRHHAYGLRNLHCSDNWHTRSKTSNLTTEYWTLRNKLQWNYNRNSNIFIQESASEIAVCEMAAILSWPQCVKNYGFFVCGV